MTLCWKSQANVLLSDVNVYIYPHRAKRPRP
jgi:hypothetical protein